MIRRNFSSENGAAGWLLISQVEHARMSGELTAAWSEPFSTEVVDAITHHDDGWFRWEATPGMDLTRGRPLSFLELDVADATRIWEASIESARRIGLLAGAIVAGHFIGLAGGSEHASQSPVKEWLETRTAIRERWLAEWHALSTTNTATQAERAQQMLYAADLLSLWLCLDGPVSAADESSRPNTEMQSRSTSVLGTHHFAVNSVDLTENRLDWRGSLSPWPFAAETLELAAPALAVPAGRYFNWPTVSAAARPYDLHWRLSREVAPS